MPADKRNRAIYLRQWRGTLEPFSPKGSEQICKKCSAKFIKKHPRQFYCSLHTTAGTASARRVGQPWRCENPGCGAPFVVTHPRMIYCEGCQELRRKLALPKDRAKQNERVNRKRKTDPAFALNRRMSCGVWRSLRDGKNGRSWEAILGYTVADLMRHIERQFGPGMSWDAVLAGEVHLDHIRPLCSYKFTSPEDPDFLAAWSLSNLRPLWKPDNLSKSGSLVLLC